MGGDLLPPPGGKGPPVDYFINDYMVKELARLKSRLSTLYPPIFTILGNDDGRFEESAMNEAADAGLLYYIHGRKEFFSRWTVYGYSYIPPTPFMLKDWERYDISRYIDPGCISPEEGIRSVAITPDEARYSTIGEDLEKLTGEDDLREAIFLFHSPPYKTNLDRSALDGRMIDHVPLDVNIGSIAIRRFIEDRQPLLTLHGHAHEAARLTGSWKDTIGSTFLFGGGHDGPELALVRFDPGNLPAATRQLM